MIKQFINRLVLNKASHLYYNRWAQAANGSWSPGTTTCDIVEILADTIAIEQGDPSEETIDWEFGDTPLMKTYTKGERTVAASCINLDFEFLQDVFGWTLHTGTGTTQLMVAEKASEEDYATIVVMFHGSNAPLIVMPKVSMSSKTTIGTLKTSTGTADLAGTAMAGYVSYSTANDTSEFFVLKPVNDTPILVAEKSTGNAVAIGKLSYENGEYSLASATSGVTATVVTSTPVGVGGNFAYLGGEITSIGSGNITQQGVILATTNNPTLDTQGVIVKEIELDGGMYKVDGLTPDTTYYVRAFAKNSAGVAYGSSETVTTQTSVAPTIVTSDAVVTDDDVLVGGYISNFDSLDPDDITAEGVAYGTSSDPEITDNTVDFTLGHGSTASFGSIGETLSAGTYHCRAYVTYDGTTYYGTDKTFTVE